MDPADTLLFIVLVQLLGFIIYMVSCIDIHVGISGLWK